jgi:hypothetical protein
MAHSFASNGRAPTTLTLMPFHTDPQQKQPQQYRFPKITQQTPPPISSYQIRNSRPSSHTHAFSTPVGVSTSHDARSIPNTPLTIIKPTVVNTHNTLRAANATNLTRIPETSPHRQKPLPNTRTARSPVTAIVKSHLIAPIGTASIDSILRAGSNQDTNKPTVPNHIRPKAEAIK